MSFSKTKVIVSSTPSGRIVAAYDATTTGGDSLKYRKVFDPGMTEQQISDIADAELFEDFKSREIELAILEFKENDVDPVARIYHVCQRPDVTTRLILDAMRSDNLKDVVQVQPVVDWATANLSQDYMLQALGISQEKFDEGMARLNSMNASMKTILKNDKKVNV